jgi:undecaprenyl-diphosphatase
MLRAGYHQLTLDWSLFHLVNGSMRGDDPLQDSVQQFGSLSAPLFALAVCALWFFARPGGSPRLKIATASALTSAGLGLLVNQVIGAFWFRERPFAAHPSDTVLLAHRSADPSFPSDHATAAFAIAFAVLFFSRRLGALFLVAATAIGVSRVLLGLHYPSDVVAGAAIGLASAVLVTTVGRPYVETAVRWLSRLSDPIVEGTTRRIAAARRSRRR